MSESSNHTVQVSGKSFSIIRLGAKEIPNIYIYILSVNMAKAVIIQFFFQGIGLEIRADQAFGLSLWCFTQKHDLSWVVSMSQGGKMSVNSEIFTRQIEKWLPRLFVLENSGIKLAKNVNGRNGKW